MAFGYKKPENIRAEPYMDFKMVYNSHWNRLMMCGGFALEGSTPNENRAKLLMYFANMRELEMALYSFIKDKAAYLETTNFFSNRKLGDIKTRINTILSNPSLLQNEVNQLKFFEDLCQWGEILIPRLRDAGVIPLEEEDFEMNPEDKEE